MKLFSTLKIFIDRFCIAKAAITGILLCFSYNAYTQSASYEKDSVLNRRPLLNIGISEDVMKIVDLSRRKLNYLGDKINETDSVFITPNKYNLAFMLEQSTWFENYKLGSNSFKGKNQSIGFAPNVNTKIGVYFGWRWIFLGYSFDINSLFGKKDRKPRTETVFNLYSSMVGVDLYYRKTGSDFKITSCNNFNLSKDYIGTDFGGFQSKIRGLNAYYIFNNKRYSYPAAYSQSTNQRRSAGSFMAGFSYSKHEVTFDQSQLPEEIQSQIEPSLSFHNLSYTDYNLSFGYGYNWVFAKNCLLNISLLPAIGYKKAKINDIPTNPELNWRTWVKDINFDLITRAGITWNNSKYYVGATLILHTYDYRKDNFSMTNSFGSLKIYVGFNFWKKKEFKGDALK